MSFLPRRFFARLLLFLTFAFLIFNSDLSVISAGATYWNRTSVHYPPGVLDELNNWGFRDAASYCSRQKGRSFSFSGDSSFPLSGLSVLVLVGGNEEAKFDASVFRLSLYKFSPGASTQPLVTNVPASQAKMIQREGNGDPTFEVYFSFPTSPALFFDGTSTYKALLECLTDEAGFYRIWEAGNLPTGLTKYYDSVTGTEAPYYMEDRKILFSLWRPRDSSVYPTLVTSSNLSIVNSQLSITPPRFHPVVLIHGLGGRPENWSDDGHQMNYQKLLSDLGYPKEYIHLYSYGLKDGKYNYQGDIKEIALNLEPVVNQLSALHKDQGGDGRVDLVGHSLGTLIARYYLNNHKTNHHVRKFVAVGAPFKGSWVMDLDQGLKEIPGIGGFAEKEATKLILSIARDYKLVGKDNANLSPSSLAAQQARSDSEFLKDLNDPNKSAADVRIYALYGDINSNFEQKIFSRIISKKISIGDGIILPQSATYLPGYSSSAIAFSDSVTITARVVKAADSTARLSWPRFDSLKYFHNNMLAAPEIKDKIKNILTND